MGENNGNIRMNPDTHIDIDEYLREQGHCVQRKADKTGLRGSIPDGKWSSSSLDSLNRQVLAEQGITLSSC